MTLQAFRRCVPCAHSTEFKPQDVICTHLVRAMCGGWQTQTQRMGGMPRGGRGMPSIHMGRTQMSGPQSGRALPAGMHVHDDEEDEEEYEDEEQEDGMDVEGAHGAGAPLTPQEEEEAFARAQTESMDVATDGKTLALCVLCLGSCNTTLQLNLNR